MARTTDKIILGVLVFMLVGMGGVFITALGSNGTIQQEKITPKTLADDISPEEATKIALNAVPGLFQEVEVENENGEIVYNVEIKQGSFDREVKINLQGNILSIETEEDDEVAPEDLEKIGGIITEEQAMEIALEEVEGRVLGVEAEREGGRVLYEVEIEDASETAEVEIDAKTGEVLEVEWEDDEDEDED